MPRETVAAALLICLLVAAPSHGDGSLTIAAVGDLMIGTDYPEDRLPPHDGARYLEAAAPLLQAADIAIGNLEGVVMDGGTPRKTCEIAAACYLFRSPARYVNHFKNAGFDALSLANNHSRDFGEAGRSYTMALLADAAIRHSGRRGDIATWQVDGQRVAFIAFSPTLKSHLLNDIPTAITLVASLAEHHDIVLVSFHGGVEGRGAERLPFEEEFYFGETRGEVVRFSRAVIDAGADLVIGHGPHVVRAMELYKNRLIAYSLGNFATHTGVNVAGANGFAPLLVTRIDADGVFLDAQLHSFVQIRPDGPQPDADNNALEMVRRLTAETFPDGSLSFGDDGTIRRR